MFSDVNETPTNLYAKDFFVFKYQKIPKNMKIIV